MTGSDWRVFAIVAVLLALVIIVGRACRGASVHSDNFVVSAETQETAQALLDRSEQLRDAIALEWLGSRLPPVKRAAIYQSDSGNIIPSAESFMLWANTDTLAHEITHVVLLTRYPDLPPWANEGVASMRDSDERKLIRAAILRWYAETGNWPQLGRTIEAEKIFAADQARYAVAESLVAFLLTKKDKATLLSFARKGDLRGHYGIDRTTLQKEWQEWVSRNY